MSKNRNKLLAVYSESMTNELQLLEEMIKDEIFLQGGDFVVGLTSDSRMVPTFKVILLIKLNTMFLEKFNG